MSKKTQFQANEIGLINQIDMQILDIRVIG